MARRAAMYLCGSHDEYAHAVEHEQDVEYEHVVEHEHVFEQTWIQKYYTFYTVWEYAPAVERRVVIVVVFAS